MAYATKYRIPFADRDGVLFRAEIMKDGYVGGVTELTPSSQPCMINYDGMSDKFDPINGSGCTLNFLNDGTIDPEDLFAIEIYEILVRIEKLATLPAVYHKVWSGYLNTEAFEEDFSWDEGEISITANDGLNAMEREKFFSGADVGDDGLVIKPWQLGIETIPNTIATCIEMIDIGRVYVMADVAGAISDFETLSVDLSNYVDEDGESMSKRDVLQSILEPLSLRAYVFNGVIWIVDTCALAVSASTATFEAYGRSMNRLPAYDLVYDKGMDISNDDLTFLDGNQKITLNGGLETFTTNYSAYVDKRKIIAYNPDDIAYPDTAVISQSRSNYLIVEGGYVYEDITGFAETDFGYDVTSNGMLSSYASASTDSELDQIESDYNDGIISLDKAFRITGAMESSIADDTEASVTIFGGWIPKNTDKLTITFDILFDYQSRSETDKTPIIEQSMRIKIGNYYGTVGASQTVKNWSTTPDGFVRAVDARQVNESGEGIGNWLPVTVTIENTDAYGFLEIQFMRKSIAYFFLDGTLTEITNRADGMVFFRNFNAVINSTEINDEDVEYKTESNVAFKSSRSVEINNSSRRVNGVLDRGSFINSNGEHETYFSRGSFPQSGSIGLTMAKGVMANYEVPYRVLNATLRGDTILRNVNRPNYSLDDIFNPLSVISYSDYLGTKKFLFSGGQIDLIEKTISGTWDEIFDANYTITEET